MRRFVADYGMLFVLLLLCAVISALTLQPQGLSGAAAGRRVAADVVGEAGPGARVLVAAGGHAEDVAFAGEARAALTAAGVTALDVVTGEPREARAVLERLAASGGGLDAVAATPTAAAWHLFADLESDFPTLGRPRLVVRKVWWPTFLNADNLRNIASQIAVIAVVAVGMTVVIVAGGIDLSVGSLIAVAAVVSTLLIERTLGAREATPAAMALACLAGVAVAGAIGFGSGVLITSFRLPPFLVTLGVMMAAGGWAGRLTRGETVYLLPDGFVRLARGGDVLGVPNAVLLMGVLYVAAHFLMSRTVLGRYVYAVGGNREAARLSGVPVRVVLLFAYTCSGLLAGLGGVVLASQLKSGSPNYGQTYELYVIAAVVVGGTSLSGGEGKVFGTLIGAFFIAVIQNGMNLANIDGFTQKIVFGLVLLAAVLLDRLKRATWARKVA